MSVFRPGQKAAPPTIERTCAFDAKIYKIVDSVFAVSLCPKSNKKFFQISDFSFQLPSLLVENRAIFGIILPPHRRADYIRVLEAACRFSEENFLFDKCNRQPYITLLIHCLGRKSGLRTGPCFIVRLCGHRAG